MIIAENGLYKLIKYNSSFICLDYISDSLGITLQTFQNEKSAYEIFDKVIEETNGNKNIHFDSFIRKIEDFLQ